MASTYVYPGPTNVYVPTATQGKNGGALFVDFSRNINDFKVLQYAQPVPVQNTVGLWYQMGLDERARITDNNSAKQIWMDGRPRPVEQDNSENFTEQTYRCIRRSYPSTLGKMMSEQAAWDERDRRQRMLAQQAMTVRTNRVIQVATTSGNWAASHVLDLFWFAGYWDGRELGGVDFRSFGNQTNAQLRQAVDPVGYSRCGEVERPVDRDGSGHCGADRGLSGNRRTGEVQRWCDPVPEGDR